MVDFDLSALSAPLESLRPEVEAAYSRLDTKWEAVTKALKKLPIPCDVGYTFHFDPYHPPDSLSLDWRKWKGKKRLCLVSYRMLAGPDGPEEVEDVTPYEEWGGEQRIEMLKHVPQLFQAAAEQTKQFIERIEKPEDSQ